MSEDNDWLEHGRKNVVDSSRRSAEQRARPIQHVGSSDQDNYFYHNYQQLLQGSPLFGQYQPFINNPSPIINLSPDMNNSNSSQSSNPNPSPIIIPTFTVNEDEVNSPPQKKRVTGKGKRQSGGSARRLDLGSGVSLVEPKGVANKRWDTETSDYALETLAELAKQGLKVDKSFKRQAFVTCAQKVNEKFSVGFTHENVANHLRTLKTKWNNITFVRKLSGAGFDDEEKMIVLEGLVLDDFKKAHPNLMIYVNKPIKGYELLRIVAGEDQATGSFKKGVYEQFGTPPVPNNDSSPIEVDELSANDAMHNAPTSSAMRRGGIGPTPSMQGLPSRSDSGTRSGSGRKRGSNGQLVFDAIVDKLDDMTSVVAIYQKDKADEKMGDALYSLKEFDVQVLEKAFEKLFNDPVECRKFNARPVISKKIWVEKFCAELEERDGQQ